MSYTVEKTRSGFDIVIKPDQGIAPDPYSGTADLRNVNTISMPKTIMVGYGITNSTVSGATLGKPISKATRFTSAGVAGTGTGSAQEYYILDANGKVYSSTSITGTWTYLSSGAVETGAGANDAIFFYKGFLLKTRDTKIDYWNGSTWNSGGSPMTTSITAGVPHQGITPINDAVYFLNGLLVAKITEVGAGTFNPATGATFSLTLGYYQLPAFDSSQSITSIASGSASATLTILVGGSQNVVYPFPSVTSDPTGFQTPIYVADSFIRRLVGVNQNAFILTGNVQGRGRIYITNSVQAEEFYKLPDHITGYDDPYFEWGDAIFHRASLIFGFFANKNDGTGAIVGISDVWALDIASKSFRSISNLSSSSGYANATVLIPDQSNGASLGYAYMVGYTDNASAHNIGRSSTSSGIGTGQYKTEMINVGTFFQKMTPRNAEVKFQTPLQSGESLIVTPVVDGTSQTNTTISTVGAISGVIDTTYEKAQWLQYQTTMTGNSSTSGCRIEEIRVHCTPII